MCEEDAVMSDRKVLVMTYISNLEATWEPCDKVGLADVFRNVRR